MDEHYDVIVVGGGGAALCAALGAKEKGAKVLLISKTAIAKANCTAFAGGGFTFAGPGVSWQEHRDKTLETGRLINDHELLEDFSQHGPLSVLNLQRYGVKSQVHPNGCSVAAYAPNRRVGGLGLTLPLMEEAIKKGVDLLDGHFVYAIKPEESHFQVDFFNLNDGKNHSLNAFSVIMATGGGGRTYGRTNNPVATTGDGYHMLYELGLPFRDMEFVQFYPIGLAEPELPIWFIDLGIIDQVPLTNSLGQEFLLDLLKSWGLKSGREGNLYARDRCSIALAESWQKGDFPILHLNQMTPEQWANPYYKSLLLLNRKHFDFTQIPIRVRPLVHYMSGGVVIDKNGATELPGLFACGEVTGGLDGANRIGGNALTNISHFGLKAGKNAALYAQERKAKIATRSKTELPNLDGSIKAKDLKITLNKTMDTHAGPLRDKKGLETGLKQVEEIKEFLPQVRAQSPKELRDYFELKSMLTTAQMILTGALAREESRGVHFRKDFPLELKEWQKTILQRK